MKGAIQLDDWQQEILNCDEDILLLKGRRVGGTEIFSIKSVEEMRKGQRIVMVSHTEDQAKLIIIFALEYIEKTCKEEFHMTGSKKPQTTKIYAKSGGWLQVRPVGNTGDAVRGFDADILGIDEAPLQPKAMWAAARPVVSTNAGRIWMWGTPKGKEGYFWEQYNKIHNLKKEGRFKVWYRNTEDILEDRPISESWTIEQKEGLRRILNEEKKDMSDLEYGQEYLGLFMEDIMRLYTDDLLDQIKKVTSGEIRECSNNFMGVDIARMGDDKSAFSIITNRGGISYYVYLETTSKTLTTDTEQKILEIDSRWKFRQIGIDAGSGTLGVSILDHLLNTKIRNRVIALNKRQVALDRNGKSKQMLLGEDMYLNLLSMMQHGKIAILDDDRVWASLRSVMFEHVRSPNNKTRMRIYSPRHEDSDVVESLIRAAWIANQKHLNLRIISI